MTASEIIKMLDLKKHYEGGYYKEIWKSDGVVIKNGKERRLSSTIYYLLEKGDVSCWHKLASDEMWFWHMGGTLEMSLCADEDFYYKNDLKTIKIGSNLDKSENLHAFVPNNFWQTTKIIDGDFALVSCVVSPGFEVEDFFLEPV